MATAAATFYARRDADTEITERSANEVSKSAVSWAAILAGTVVAVASTLVLILLGSGMGMAWVSPFSGDNPTLLTFSITVAIWLIVVQWLSAAAGGYIAGRLRTRWVNTHVHEVFFRDTAHGFVTWAASTLLMIALIASTSSALLGSGVRAAAAVAGNAAQGVAQGTSVTAAANDYSIDTLLRPSQPTGPSAGGEGARAEVGRILARSVSTGEFTDKDRTYLAQVVAARTGAPQADAQARVNEVYAQEKAAAAKTQEAVEATRKATSRAAIFTAVSMLIGAFVSCAAAALGGSLRDEHP